ncbi:MAG: hypothetical protein LUG25_08180, partial [Oscillospiraceae bacterium]|nr:hypothetical protein [Oscillospiraceae bacterium]
MDFLFQVSNFIVQSTKKKHQKFLLILQVYGIIIEPFHRNPMGFYKKRKLLERGAARHGEFFEGTQKKGGVSVPTRLTAIQRQTL